MSLQDLTVLLIFRLRRVRRREFNYAEELLHRHRRVSKTIFLGECRLPNREGKGKA